MCNAEKIVRRNVRQFFLKEGLIKSYSTHELERLLFRKFQNNFKYGYDLNIRKDEDGIELDFKNFDKESYILFKQLVNNAGYFISLIYIEYLNGKNEVEKYSENLLLKILGNKNNCKKIELTLEKKYDSKYPQIRFLYHVTPIFNINKIKKNGLCPKTKSKKSYHPERVYLTKRKEDAIKAVDLFKKYENSEYVLLKVDTKKIKHRITIYNDPNFTMGFYTYDVLPPYSISIEQKI